MSIFACAETIPEFFADRHLFITGASGFMGKVLIEKLLRSCPGIEKIYVLIRQKKGKSGEERLKEITDLPLFDRLRNEQPGFSDKLKVVTGDVTLLNLGLSAEDRKTLVDNVSIVYHAAASVRFDDPLSDAIIMNTRGTREVVLLAKEMKNIAMFVHISTTYCNTDKTVVEEKLYPPHGDWRAAIKMAEEADKNVVDIMTAKYIGALPNTYTFTKSLAEHVVNDLCNGQIPAVIFRPSIVISTLKEPMPGWNDNFNGPVGLLVASGKGLVKTVYARPDIVADYVPVDVAIKALIIGTWFKGTCKNLNEKLQLSCYNCSNHKVAPITMAEMIHVAKTITWETPLNDIMWYPTGDVSACEPYFYIKVILLQVLPAIFIDLIFRALGRKPMLVKLQRRIFAANMALQHFLMNQWEFINTKCLGLEDYLLPSDRPSFEYNKNEVDVFKYFRDGMLGARQYLLKEDNSTMEQARKHSRRMWFLNQVTVVLWYFFLIWMVFFKINIPGYFVSKYYELLSV